MDVLEQIEQRLARIEAMLLEQRRQVSEILDMDAAVSYTGYSKHYLYHLTSTREIPHCKRNRKIFFRRAELDAWLTAGKVKTKEDVMAEAERFCKTLNNKKNERNYRSKVG